MKPTMRIARANRLLAEVGHEDVNEALRHMQRMQTALKVIYTWARVPGALDEDQVRKLCDRALSKEYGRGQE